MVRAKAKVDYCRLVPALELQMPTPTHGPPSPATKDHKCFGKTASMHAVAVPTSLLSSLYCMMTDAVQQTGMAPRLYTACSRCCIQLCTV